MKSFILSIILLSSFVSQARQPISINSINHDIIMTGNANGPALIKRGADTGELFLSSASTNTDPVAAEVTGGTLALIGRDTQDANYSSGYQGDVIAFLGGGMSPSENVANFIISDAGFQEYFHFSTEGNADFHGYASFNDPFTGNSAVLQLNSTTSAFVPPKMTTAQKIAISSPVVGSIVYDTDLNKLCVYAGSWLNIATE